MMSTILSLKDINRVEMAIQLHMILKQITILMGECEKLRNMLNNCIIYLQMY